MAHILHRIVVSVVTWSQHGRTQEPSSCKEAFCLFNFDINHKKPQAKGYSSVLHKNCDYDILGSVNITHYYCKLSELTLLSPNQFTVAILVYFTLGKYCILLCLQGDCNSYIYAWIYNRIGDNINHVNEFSETSVIRLFAFLCR